MSVMKAPNQQTARTGLRSAIGYGLLCCLSLLVYPNARADFNDAVVAYLRGEYDNAFLMMQAQAEGNEDNLAMYYLGVMYERGQGVDPDSKQAGKWFRMAAQAGVPQAQFRLGNLYMRGDGVPRDYERAFVWFSVAGFMEHGPSKIALERARAKLSEEELEAAEDLARQYIRDYVPKNEEAQAQPPGPL